MTTSLAAPESLRMRIMKNKAPTGAVGCTINTALEAILETLNDAINTFSRFPGKAEAHSDASIDQGIAALRRGPVSRWQKEWRKCDAHQKNLR